MYLAEAAHVLDYYGDHFGKYPYRKLALVETDFPGGYGATSAVALPHVAFDRPAVADEFLAHEIAHNWTDLVSYQGSLGERGFMAEGVASYLDLLYHGARDGAQGFRRRLQEAHRRYVGILGTAEDLPIGEATQDDRRLWQLLTYDKAAIVLHMLRQEIGDKAFDQGLRELYARRAGQSIGVDDFQAAFDRASGKNMGYFFRQWLTRSGVPMIEASGLQVKALGGGKYELAGVLSQHTLPFVLTVPLVVVSGAGQMVYNVPVRAFHTPFRLRVPGKPRVFLIDPLRDALLVSSPPVTLR
jgi:aminopeptidase N